MTAHDLARLRLSAQHIAQADFATSEAVVRHLGALQAQDYAGAQWSIGLRMSQAAEFDIEQAVIDRRIVRSWPQRGTLHFVPPEELRWRLRLAAPRVLAAARRRHQELELTPADFTKAQELVTTALQGDRRLARPALLQLLEAGGLSTAGQRGYHLLWQLAQTGHICFGPLEGRQPTIALLDDWVPPAPAISRAEALARLVVGYFSSHGPATLRDLAWWSGLTRAELKQGLAAVEDQLDSVVVADTTYYLAPNLRPAESSQAYLLPGFDEFILGYADRSAALDPANAERICPGGNGLFRPTVVLDGRVVGTWQRGRRQSDQAAIVTAFGEPLDKIQLQTSQQRYARYRVR